MAERLGRSDGTAQVKSDAKFPARLLAAIIATVGLALADATPYPSTEQDELVQAEPTTDPATPPEKTAKVGKLLSPRC